jgi:prepilin-type N-terminal cleavage/methylation domain-containing protein
MMQLNNKQLGFTLIEMIVSLALFSIVITISIGALLVLIGTNEQLQGEQSVMTNLSFALDSMTREIRTGTEYYCYTTNNTGGNNNLINDNNDIDQVLDDRTDDCSNGNNASQNYHGLAFKEGGDSITEDDDRILYYFEKQNDEDVGQIYRRVGAGTAQSILADGIGIRNLEFFVTGSASLEDGDQYQPTVTVLIEAVDLADPNSKVYRLQTTITQRTFDL